MSSLIMQIAKLSLMGIIACLAIVGFWQAGGQTFGNGVVGLLILFLIGVPISWRGVKCNLASFFPDWVNIHIWVIGASFPVTKFVVSLF